MIGFLWARDGKLSLPVGGGLCQPTAPKFAAIPGGGLAAHSCLSRGRNSACTNVRPSPNSQLQRRRLPGAAAKGGCEGGCKGRPQRAAAEDGCKGGCKGWWMKSRASARGGCEGRLRGWLPRVMARGGGRAGRQQRAIARGVCSSRPHPRPHCRGGRWQRRSKTGASRRAAPRRTLRFLIAPAIGYCK